MSFSRRSRRRRLGTTLVEALVFASILLLLMGSIVMVLQAGMKHLRTGAAYQDAQRETMLGMSAIVEGLRNGNGTPEEMSPNLRALNPGENSNFLIIMSPHKEDLAAAWTYPEGRTDLHYYRWLCFYHNDQLRELVASWLPIPGAPKTALDLRDDLEFPDLTDFYPPGNRKARVAARGVTRLAFEIGPRAQQVAVELDCTVETGTDRVTTVTSRSVVYLPNR